MVICPPPSPLSFQWYICWHWFVTLGACYLASYRLLAGAVIASGAIQQYRPGRKHIWHFCWFQKLIKLKKTFLISKMLKWQSQVFKTVGYCVWYMWSLNQQFNISYRVYWGTGHSDVNKGLWYYGPICCVYCGIQFYILNNL